MTNIEMLVDSISQHLTNTQNGQPAYMSTIGLKYAYRQLKIQKDTAKHNIFNITCGEFTRIFEFKTGFYGLTHLPVEFQKAMHNTFVGLQNIYCFLVDIIIVNTGPESDHLTYVVEGLRKLNAIT